MGYPHLNQPVLNLVQNQKDAFDLEFEALNLDEQTRAFGEVLSDHLWFAIGHVARAVDELAGYEFEIPGTGD